MGTRRPSIAATALAAASAPASSVKCSSRVVSGPPGALGVARLHHAGGEADMKAQSSAWGSGIALEAIASAPGEC